MSQAKVDRYKKEKKNRQKVIKKQKFKKAIVFVLCSFLVGAAIGYPLGKVIYKQYKIERDANATFNAGAMKYEFDKYWTAKYAGNYNFVADQIASSADAEEEVLATASDAE